MDYTAQTNIRILIADESTSQRSQLKETLRRAGFHMIDEAANGDEALQKIDHLHPDIAIIDIWLSKLDGIGVIRASSQLDYRSDKAPSFIMTSP